MYNTDLPNRAELPSSKQLLRSTIIAAVIAAVLLVTVVLPSEYGIDPTRIGSVLGLTRMGEIKMALAREAEQDRIASARQSANTPSQPVQQTQMPATQMPPEANSAAKIDEMSVTLKPGEGTEIKLEMAKDGKVTFEWTTIGGPVNYDTHGDSPQIDYHGYSKGQQVERDAGELIAAFDGKHGWYWRNRGSTDVTITLKATGEFKSIKRMM